MRKIWKRAVALLCALSMVAGGILTWNNQEAKAATEVVCTVDPSAISESTRYACIVETFGLNIADDAERDTLSLELTLEVDANIYAHMQSDNGKGYIYVELGQGNSGGWTPKYSWTMDATKLVQGANELSFALSESTKSGNIDYTSAINYFRLYYYQKGYEGDGGELNTTFANNVAITKLQVVKNVVDEWKDAVVDLTSITKIGTYALTTSSFGVKIADDAERDTLSLELTLEVDANMYAHMQSDNGKGYIYVELGQGNSGGWTPKYSWTMDATKLVQGVNELSFALSESTKSGNIDYTSAINYFRLYYYQKGYEGDGGELNTTFANYVDITKLQVVKNVEGEEEVNIGPYIKEYQASLPWTIVGEEQTLVSDQPLLSNLNLDMSTANADTLALSVTLNIPEDVWTTWSSGKRLEIILYTNEARTQFYQVNVLVGDLRAGEVTVQVPYSSMSSTENNISKFDSSTLNLQEVTIYSCQLRYRTAWSGTPQHGSMAGVTVKNLALVDTTACYVEAGKTPSELGLDVSDVPEDYIFAGWYTDEACTTANALEGIASGKAYAKFVRKGILNVKVQTAVDSNATDNKGIIRFVSTVDSVQYREVGFVITVNGTTAPALTSTEVYSELYAIGNITYKPTDIDAASLYFNAITFSGVPTNTDLTISVKAYWITQDGTTVYGDERALPTINIVSQ